MTLIIIFTDIIVIKKYDNLSFKSKHSFLNLFFGDLDKSNNLNPEKESTKQKKINLYDKASKLYNYFQRIYYHTYYELSDDKKKKKNQANTVSFV